VTAYYIDSPLSGSAVSQWHDGGLLKTTTGSAAVFTPGTPCALDWSGDCGQICLKVSESQMRRQLEAMLNRPVRKRISFARRFDLGTTAAKDWYQLVQLLAREVGQPGGLLNHQLVVQNLQLVLVQGLLQIHPHNYTEALTEGEHAASTAVAKRAIDLLHAHPEKPWTIAGLAQATGVSSRALQRSFGRSDLPSPMVYLRRLRLNRAHAELTAGCAGSVTVTMIAGRWGFAHLGRFANQYRQLFGETPSETLRGHSASRPAGVRRQHRGTDARRAPGRR
jgi:AraC-like DNA-binding protein